MMFLMFSESYNTFVTIFVKYLSQRIWLHTCSDSRVLSLGHSQQRISSFFLEK
eukprot:UN25127